MLNIRGRLVDISRPWVMGIVNATPDSFFAASRSANGEAAVVRARQLMDEGADILDVGACSTRPGAEPVDAETEWQRLAPVLEALRREWPESLLSVDTFRASVARRSVEEFGINVINDISAGELDEAMFPTVAELRVPYVLMHGGSAASMLSEDMTDGDVLLSSVARYLAARLQQLYALGVSDVLLDPGFGFGKTLGQNYSLLRRLPALAVAFPGVPFLVGVSRKSMIHRLLDISPDEALNGTTVLNTLALQAGAHILRVHDVRQAVEAVRIWERLNNDG